jgi:hypothetical protein
MGDVRRRRAREAGTIMARSFQRRLQTLAPLPENLLSQPIEYLRADHFRLETLSRVLGDAPAGSDGGLDDAARDALVAFLDDELPRHMADEEDDLFPLIDGRCPADSPLHPLVGLLGEMHGRMDALRADLSDGLHAAAKTGKGPSGRRFWQSARAFGELLHWNVAIEDRVVLPLAAACLAAAELDGLGRAMAARRHAVYPVLTD